MISRSPYSNQGGLTTNLYSKQGHVKLSMQADGNLALCELKCSSMGSMGSLSHLFVVIFTHNALLPSLPTSDGCGCNESTPDAWKKMWSSKTFWDHTQGFSYGGEFVQESFVEPQPEYATLRLDERCDNHGCNQASMEFGWEQSTVYKPLLTTAALDCGGSTNGKLTGPLTLTVQGVRYFAFVFQYRL
jgi:hypothetical protein